MSTVRNPANNRKIKKAPVKVASGGMKFAVIETGGKQYRVASKDVIKIEKLSGEPKVGEKIIFSKVLLFDDGKKLQIGTPYVKDIQVVGVLEEEGRGKKISVIKFKSKIRYFKKYGHRQPYVKVKIK